MHHFTCESQNCWIFLPNKKLPKTRSWQQLCQRLSQRVKTQNTCHRWVHLLGPQCYAWTYPLLVMIYSQSNTFVTGVKARGDSKLNALSDVDTRRKEREGQTDNKRHGGKWWERKRDSDSRIKGMLPHKRADGSRRVLRLYGPERWRFKAANWRIETLTIQLLTKTKCTLHHVINDNNAIQTNWEAPLGEIPNNWHGIETATWTNEMT